MSELESLKRWLLMRVPYWFRSHGPLRRFYYQAEDIEHARQWATDFRREMGWDKETDDAG